jgi:signal recognition particle receptor subunit beta
MLPCRHLHHVLHSLVSLPPSRPQPALLVLAHKADLIKTGSASTDVTPESLAIARVRSVLERELEKRAAQSAGSVGIEGLGAEGENTEMGGLECAGGPFRFENWEGGEVTILATSAVGKTPVVDEKRNETVNGLCSLLTWLENLA